MKKTKLFIDNILIYGLGGVINKTIPIIMLPIVTRLMPDTSYFGINDLQSTVVSFISAVAMLGVYDALYRLFFEKDDDNYKKSMCTTALVIVMVMALIASLGLIILKKQIAIQIFHNEQYDYLCVIAAITIIADNIKGIVQAPTRMQNQRKVYIVTNMLTSVFIYILAVPMILKGYFVTALPLAALVSSLIMVLVFWALNHSWFEMKLFNKNHISELLKIGIPLMPTFIIFWVFNSCDKLMISSFLGVAANGIYAVGSKLAHASQILNTAFGGGWSFFVYSTMKDKDRVESNSMIFELMSAIIFLCSLGVFVLAKPIYQLFFTGDYVSGYIVSPYLFCAPLMQMLFYVASDQLLIIKKAWPITAMLAFGAVVNVGLNYILIPILGIEGAAISTMLGYTVSLIVCLIIVNKAKLLRISMKCYILILEFFVFIVLWKIFRENIVFGFAYIILYFINFIIFYKDILHAFILKFKRKEEEYENTIC